MPSEIKEKSVLNRVFCQLQQRILWRFSLSVSASLGVCCIFGISCDSEQLLLFGWTKDVNIFQFFSFLNVSWATLRRWLVRSVFVQFNSKENYTESNKVWLCGGRVWIGLNPELHLYLLTLLQSFLAGLESTQAHLKHNSQGKNKARQPWRWKKNSRQKIVQKSAKISVINLFLAWSIAAVRENLTFASEFRVADSFFFWYPSIAATSGW